MGARFGLRAAWPSFPQQVSNVSQDSSFPPCLGHANHSSSFLPHRFAKLGQKGPLYCSVTCMSPALPSPTQGLCHIQLLVCSLSEAWVRWMPPFFLQRAWRGSVDGMVIKPGCDLQRLSPCILVMVLVREARPWRASRVLLPYSVSLIVLS